MDIADKRRVSAAAGRPGTRHQALGTRHQASVPGKIQSNVATECNLAAWLRSFTERIH